MLRESILLCLLGLVVVQSQLLERLASRDEPAPAPDCSVDNVMEIDEAKSKGLIKPIEKSNGWWVGLLPAIFKCQTGNDWHACKCDRICKKYGYAYGHCACEEKDCEGFSHCHCTTGCCHKT